MALTRLLVITLFFIVFALSSTTTNPVTSMTSSAGLAFAIAPSSFNRRMPSSSSSRAKMKQPVKRKMIPSSRTRHTTRESDKKTIENSFSESNGVDIGGSGSGNEGEAPIVVKEGEGGGGGGGDNMDNVLDATDASSDRRKKSNSAFEPQPHWKKGFDKNKERRGRFPPSKQPSAKGKAWRKPSDLIDPNMNEDENHETVNRAAAQGGKAVPTLPSQRNKKGKLL